MTSRYIRDRKAYNRFGFQGNQNNGNQNLDERNIQSIINFDRYYQENQKKFDDLSSINTILRRNDTSSTTI